VPADDKKGQGQRTERGRGQPKIPLASPAAWLVLIALAVFLFRAFQDVGVRRVPYSQFKEMVRQGTFEKVVIGPDWVRGIPKGVGDSDKGGQALPYMATRIPGGMVWPHRGDGWGGARQATPCIPKLANHRQQIEIWRCLISQRIECRQLDVYSAMRCQLAQLRNLIGRWWWIDIWASMRS
jgi:hypothetical protein